MDRWALVVSTLFFFVSFGWTMFTLGAGKYHRSRFNLMVMGTGFVFQTLFLYQRSQMLGRCPLTNLFEVFVFLSWSVVLLYLLVGPAYRLTLLGAFTAPVVSLLQMFALTAPIDIPAPIGLERPDPWLELHAAVSIVSYGAFALAGVAGVMFLAQERQLKTHHIRTIFFHLPPINELATATRRLLITGMALLTFGLLTGFAIGSPHVKVLWGGGVWVVYGLILILRPRVSTRRFAWLSVIAFALTLVSLWSINQMPAPHP